MHFCTQAKSLPTGGMRKNYRFCEKNSALQNGSKAGLPALRPLEKTKAFPTYFPPSRFPNDRLFADENRQRRTRRLLSHRAFTCFPFHLRCPAEKEPNPILRSAPMQPHGTGDTLCIQIFFFPIITHRTVLCKKNFTENSNSADL